MSEPTANDPIRYEQPAIVRRDSIAGLLSFPGNLPSDAPPINPSDVNVKENIRPVRW
jgi:hypothetical protein